MRWVGEGDGFGEGEGLGEGATKYQHFVSIKYLHEKSSVQTCIEAVGGMGG